MAIDLNALSKTRTVVRVVFATMGEVPRSDMTPRRSRAFWRERCSSRVSGCSQPSNGTVGRRRTVTVSRTSWRPNDTSAL